ncbi:ABC transporter permease [Acinetobacter stercoris]|uniref:Outer membrane-specific lipoprotein transporter subunit LolE n=1 Tax=Acinetobacter stercoris TaxID=2126983 RepID=A0A2U3MXP8_9GAMM|nr:FtsX-like permease family protein [Acinetobacter stercoris]SPL70212.1 outer membrane-specific lipoprotein transporter subunit LolE [Acinetobacter stercoris]
MMGLFKPLLRQSFQSTGIYLLIIALSLAISATTALKFSNDQVQHAVELQAAKMLAADLVLSDQQPIQQNWKIQAQRLNLEQSEVTMFGSMAHTNDQFVMVNVKAIDSAFPLRGELTVQPMAKQIKSGEVWLSQRAMDLLHVNIRDDIKIADGTFKVAAKIQHDSNQEIGFSAFSPTVIISHQDIAKTNAIQTGSRIEYRLLLSGSPKQVQAYKQLFQQFENKEKNKNQLQPQTQYSESSTEQAIGAASTLKLRDAGDANTRLMKPIQNLDTFLKLANILTILLCGIAIALTSQRYVQQNHDHIALIRCLGAKRSQILNAYVLLLLIVVGISILIGSVSGLILGYALLELMLGLIPNLELQFSLFDLLLGPLPIAIFTSAIVLFGFVLPSLWALLNTPPIRVIRQQEKNVMSLAAMIGIGIISLIIFSFVLTSDLRLTALVITAVILLSVLLYFLVWGILKLFKALKNQISSYVRTPSQTALQVTALALGLSLITVLAVLRTDLLERWLQQLPAGTPNQFVYGLPPFELQQFKQQLKQHQWKSTALYPNIRGRLVAKNGQAFPNEIIEKKNSLKRELNLTQTEHYPEDNKILAGNMVLKNVGDVSVESKLAEELGINVGDKLTFSLPEGQLIGNVVNIRSVEWQSFSPNFFFIFAPNTLDENAGSYLGSFYVPANEKKQLVSLVQQFPNTVFIDVSLILDEVARLINVLVQIVTVLAILVSLSGFLVLIACINLLMDERKREVALLRSFGSSKAKLKNMMSMEIGFIGLMAGIVSCFFAEVISAIASYKMELIIQVHWEIWIILPVVMTVLCMLIGRYRLSYLSEIPPLQSLREINQ